MNASWIIIAAMVLTEVGTNCHALFPPVYLGSEVVDGVIVERYAEEGIDPWTVRMVSLSLASAFMAFLFALLKVDGPARAFAIAWGLYYVFQAVQKMTGLNVAPYDWSFDAVIMAAFIGGAWGWNRFVRPAILRVVHKHSA
jgi:hypothetical protein